MLLIVRGISQFKQKMKEVTANKKSRSTPLKIRYIEIKKKQTVAHLLNQMKYNAFNARKLFNCAEIWLKACIENTRKYFTLATAIIPAGYGKLIGQMIENKMIDVLITTSANMALPIISQYILDSWVRKD